VLATTESRAEAFGCAAVIVDGHDITQIDDALAAARNAGWPVVVLARTVKGKGFTEIEDKNGWHDRPLLADTAEQAVAGLDGGRNLHVTPAEPDRRAASRRTPASAVAVPRYELSAKVSTRKAYEDALVALGSARPDVVALDGEVGNSTYAELFAVAYTGRSLEMFIAEQQLIAAAVSLAVRGYVPFASTVAAFFCRGHDFLRMGASKPSPARACGCRHGSARSADCPAPVHRAS
jgi:transketolase